MVLIAALAAWGALLACGGPAMLFDVTVLDVDAVAPGLVLGADFGEGSSLFLVDRDGRARWLRPADTGFTVANALVSGDRLLYDSMLGRFPFGYLYALSLTQPEVERVDTPDLHHSFTVLPDGTLAWLELDVRETAEWGSVVGDRIVERRPSGLERTVTSLWDHLPVEPNEFFDDDFYPQGKDWTHANALTFAARDDTYVVTSRNLGAILEFDRASGAMVGYLDGADLPGDLALHAPHAARRTDDGTWLVFTSDRRGTESWAIELAPAADGTVTEVWSHGRGEGVFAHAKGEARRLANGSTLINWGSAGLVREVDPDGQVVWEARLRSDLFLGTTSVVEAADVALLAGG